MSHRNIWHELFIYFIHLYGSTQNNIDCSQDFKVFLSTKNKGVVT